MCLLVVLRLEGSVHHTVVASNRDEDRSRRSAPPGLFVGSQHRMLSPRDRLAGGTWLAVDDRGRFAGLTNYGAPPAVPLHSSRGKLPHLALDQPSLGAAVEAVRKEVEQEAYAGFQLVLAEEGRTMFCSHDGDGILRAEEQGPQLVIGNQHRPETLTHPGVAAAAAPGLDLERRFELLREVLMDTGDVSGHAILKQGGEYGTVSSSLIALPREDIHDLRWDFAPGPPDQKDYRHYGNLARRLVED